MIISHSIPSISHVVIHPLVLLSVVDHYNRVAKDARNKRVVGILLGETYKGKVDVTNSYAVPFEEDSKDKNIWFFDHIFHENMYNMYRKVSAKEVIVGWYSSGPNIRPNDIEINEKIKDYLSTPVFVIIDVNPKDDLTIPTDAYIGIHNMNEEKEENRLFFQHITSEVGAFEAEEIGVEHLLRDVRDTTTSSLIHEIHNKLNTLKQLEFRIKDIISYLHKVVTKELPINNDIIGRIQNILNLCPHLDIEDLSKSFAININDSMLTIYLSSIIRAIISLHNLIENKLHNKKEEENKRKKEKEIIEKIEKEKSDKMDIEKK